VRHRLATRRPLRRPSRILAHAQARPGSSRRIDLEPGKPVHRLDRRRPHRQGRGAGPCRRPAAEGRGLRVRPLLHLGAEAGDLDPLVRARRDGSHLAAGDERLAPERAPLRRAAGPGQGRDDAQVRRRAGARLAAQLRHPAAGADPGRSAQRAQRSALPRPARRRRAADRMPQGHGCPRSCPTGTSSWRPPSAPASGSWSRPTATACGRW
jgi:hypothetical protein